MGTRLFLHKRGKPTLICRFTIAARHRVTFAIMSSQTLNTITDELQRASYKAVLIQIVHGLEKQQQEELRFYYNGLIPGETTGTLNILRSLENVRKISWMDVSSLKESLCVVGRNDLAETLTAYEIKRNLKVMQFSI